MRQAASRGRARLPDAARTAAFLRGRTNPDGGFADRAGRSDLYYTVFGLESLAAMGEPPPDNLHEFLARSIAQIDSLDFVHLTCLARCVGPEMPADLAEQIIARLETFRTADGGYSQWPGSAHGTTYGCILALGTYQDLGVDGAAADATDAPAPLPPEPQRLLECLGRLRARDGGYLNEPGQSAGLTPATAAAVTVQTELGQGVEQTAVDWLLARHVAGGGFSALPGLPLADLLSTATALHALSRAGADVAPLAGPCQRFVLSMWADGPFTGHAFDAVADCEYTFYGLLALGELGA